MVITPMDIKKSSGKPCSHSTLFLLFYVANNTSDFFWERIKENPHRIISKRIYLTDRSLLAVNLYKIHFDRLPLCRLSYQSVIHDFLTASEKPLPVEQFLLNRFVLPNLYQREKKFAFFIRKKKWTERQKKERDQNEMLGNRSILKWNIFSCDIRESFFTLLDRHIFYSKYKCNVLQMQSVYIFFMVNL